MGAQSEWRGGYSSIVQVAHRSQQARFAGPMGGRHRLAERLRSQGRKARVRSPSFS